MKETTVLIAILCISVTALYAQKKYPHQALQTDIFQAVSIKPAKIQKNQGERVLIFQETRTLLKDQFASYTHAKNAMSDKKYEVEILVYSGDPDLYIYAYTGAQYRPIRASESDQLINEKSYYLKSDLLAGEEGIYIEVYGYTDTRFQINIYELTPTCKPETWFDYNGNKTSEINCTLTYPEGHDLTVRIGIDDPGDIYDVQLTFRDQVFFDDSPPYQFVNIEKNMAAGSYPVRLTAYDYCGNYLELECLIVIQKNCSAQIEIPDTRPSISTQCYSTTAEGISLNISKYQDIARLSLRLEGGSQSISKIPTSNQVQWTGEEILSLDGGNSIGLSGLTNGWVKAHYEGISAFSIGYSASELSSFRKKIILTMEDLCGNIYTISCFWYHALNSICPEGNLKPGTKPLKELCTIDAVPAATILLPYFELSDSNSGALPEFRTEIGQNLRLELQVSDSADISNVLFLTPANMLWGTSIPKDSNAPFGFKDSLSSNLPVGNYPFAVFVIEKDRDTFMYSSTLHVVSKFCTSEFWFEYAGESTPASDCVMSYPAGHDLSVKIGGTQLDELSEVSLYFRDQVFVDMEAPFEFADIEKNMAPGSYPLRMNIINECGDTIVRVCSIIIEETNCVSDFKFTKDKPWIGCAIVDLEGVHVDVTDQSDISRMSLSVEGGTGILTDSIFPYFWSRDEIKTLSGNSYSPAVPVVVTLFNNCDSSIQKTCTWYDLPSPEDCNDPILKDQFQDFCATGSHLSDTLLINYHDIDPNHPDSIPLHRIQAGRNLVICVKIPENLASAGDQVIAGKVPLITGVQVERPGNILWGDYFYLDETRNFAEGETLVHIEADTLISDVGFTFYGRYVQSTGADQREPLATSFAARYFTNNSSSLKSNETDTLVRIYNILIEPRPCSTDYWFEYEDEPRATQDCIMTYPAGHNLSVKVGGENTLDIKEASLLFRDQVFFDDSHPYQWKDIEKNMAPGSYPIRLTILSDCGDTIVRECMVIIEPDSCTSDFWFEYEGTRQADTNCNMHYQEGHDLSIVTGVENPENIREMVLFFRDQLFFDDTYPFGWLDIEKNMAPGSYPVSISRTDNCGYTEEKNCTIVISACEMRFPEGHNLSIRLGGTNQKDIKEATLLFRDQLFFDDTAPIEWIDIEKNMVPGAYPIQIRLIDECGDTSLRECLIVIEPRVCSAEFWFEFEGEKIAETNCELVYPEGHNLTVKVAVENEKDIKDITLLFRDQAFFDNSYPFEWEDIEKNMSIGSYPISLILTDKCGTSIRKECMVVIEAKTCGTDVWFEFPIGDSILIANFSPEDKNSPSQFIQTVGETQAKKKVNENPESSTEARKGTESKKENSGEDIGSLIGDTGIEIPGVFGNTEGKSTRGLVLVQNVPNPFNESTLIRFYNPISSSIELKIFTLSGVLLMSHTAEYEKGWHEVEMHKNQLADKGVYLYELSNGEEKVSRKMMTIE